MIQFGIRLNVAKSRFFDRKAIQRELGKVELRAFRHYGGLVRKVARNSIRRPPKTKRSRVPTAGTFFGQVRSKPGNPPFSHTGLLREHIFFAYDKARRSVVIGPAKLSGHANTAPHALEYGGPSRSSSGVIVNIRPRPYMGPAAVEGDKQLPEIWRKARAA
jgi:hypothetical protein